MKKYSELEAPKKENEEIDMEELDLMDEDSEMSDSASDLTEIPDEDLLAEIKARGLAPDTEELDLEELAEEDDEANNPEMITGSGY